ncbi:hypothetical protein KAT80_01905 [Candidatus Pacearchaeota archaeon]|nr:hypothetical protein [Candidatus Pacearchaeota archaeon]
MEEVENILRILEETKVALKNKDTLKLKQLSDQTNNTASRTQDADNIAVAVIVYSLGKILERGYVENLNVVTRKIDEVMRSAKKDENLLKKNLKQLRAEIGKTSPGMKKYIQEVFRKASINKASKIYGHGVSMQNTAKLLGITVWELANYAGQTGVLDAHKTKTLGVRERIKLVKEIFQ